MVPTRSRQRRAMSKLVTLRSSAGDSSRLTSPRCGAELSAPTLRTPGPCAVRNGWSPIVVSMWRMGGSPSSSESSSPSSPAARSIRRTISAVTAAGVPCGMVRKAAVLSASMGGRKLKRIQPPPTMAKVTSSPASISATVR